MTMTALQSTHESPSDHESTSDVVPLGDARACDRARCGGKAARLAQLTAAGFAVPAGFVITVQAAHAFAGANHLDATSTPAEVEAAALGGALSAMIRAALARLGDGPVAVRSSAIAEDLAAASFAGLYESRLDVRGADDVLAAVKRVWASAHDARVAHYAGPQSCTGMAVLVQRMVSADSAGVAFSADPVTGARDVTIVSAVRGLGERLVSGMQSAEEWRLERDRALRVRDDGVLGAEQARAVAALAARVAADAGTPQDIEWAFEGPALQLLQARPMTALPEEVRWETPWGGWLRNFRLGEWIGGPVTPAFESWLLSDVERSMHAHFEDVTGFVSPAKTHVVVNGWYFYGMNLTGPERFAGLRLLLRIPFILLKAVLNFRAFAGLNPPTAHLGFDWGVRQWREQLLPAYRQLVADAERAARSAPVAELPSWIDRIGACVGRNFGSVVAVGGYSAKVEMKLVTFLNAHAPALRSRWLELVRTGDAAEPAPHDVAGLDWSEPTLGELGVSASKPDAATRARVTTERDAALQLVREALGGNSKLVAKLDALVVEAQRAHAVREEQARAMTLAWPALRRAILRIGEQLVASGVLTAREQVFFLERSEILSALDGPRGSLASRAREREQTWKRQRRLPAPLQVGQLPPLYAAAFAQAEALLHGSEPSKQGELRGHPGSPGRVTGRVKVLRDVSELSRLAPGDIPVPADTTPAWTAAFAGIAAVVTDTGSIASHASIVAREYGIPAVVATGDATSRLHDGQVVTVDGSAGVVSIDAGAPSA